jgi:hypothetical protein
MADSGVLSVLPVPDTGLLRGARHGKARGRDGPAKWDDGHQSQGRWPFLIS